MKEEWRDIAGYEGKYQVSNLGRVKSLDYNQTGLENILNLHLDSRKRYIQVGLSKKGIVNNYLVHRLVAQAFLENPDNLPCINHKDENKQNNRVDNLEWCTYQYNLTYADKHLKYARKVGCYKDGKLIKTYDIMQDVEKDGFSKGNVCSCCQGNRKSHSGYQWKYE